MLVTKKNRRLINKDIFVLCFRVKKMCEIKNGDKEWVLQRFKKAIS